MAIVLSGAQSGKKIEAKLMKMRKLPFWSSLLFIYLTVIIEISLYGAEKDGATLPKQTTNPHNTSSKFDKLKNCSACHGKIEGHSTQRGITILSPAQIKAPEKRGSLIESKESASKSILKERMFSVKNGIAKTFLSFNDLKGHPDVIFIDTFEGTTIKPDWFWQKKVRGDQVNNGYLTGNIDPIRKNRSAFNIRYFFSKHIKEEPTEISFRYSIRFHKNFIYATQGGKLPGQAGTYNSCGWGGRRPDNKCRGWSARMHFKKPIKIGPDKDMIPIGTYLYHLDQKDYYGDQKKWQAFCKLDQWCELEQYIKLNTPGNNDGILRGYHNGMLVYEKINIRYRNHDEVKIEDIWTLVYHGGTGLPKKIISADIDNVVIAKSYIGPLKQSNGKLE